MPEQLHIRQYQAADHDAVWNLHIGALENIQASWGPGPWDSDFENIEGVYIQSGGDFLVGELEGRIVAMAALKKMSDDHAELKRMRVSPSLQRQGYGQAMLEAIEARARELGFKELTLETEIIQAAAWHLYEKNGYKETRRDKSRDHETIFYRKILQP